MKYRGIRKIHEGKFITRYDVDYVTAQGHEKTYEIVSRNRDIRTLEDLQNNRPDSVIMILTDMTGERILVSREYRMAMAQWIYNFPAGLIDPGETPEQSAKRELWEETGLELARIDDVLDGSYSAIGFSNERNICVFGAASGEFRESTSDAEEIVPGWYTKEEMRALLRTEMFAARTQAYCYAWAYGVSEGRFC
ncbi:MAG: NUDIX hydrolase [Clostridiales bacterium]|nr:NUDIX hydrolase [Clostridiales bacterium]